ncbi:MAG: hypothetical protein QM736_16605 [Vicinamibacterales bacterium]
MNPSYINPEDIILSAYFGQKPPKSALREAITALGVTRRPSDFSQLQAAAGTVLLGATRRGFGRQELLDRDGLSAGVRRVQRWGSFRPQHLITIDWADSIPGSSTSAYFAVRVPTHKAMVVVLSAPTSEMFGYFDVALGFATAAEPNAAAGVRNVLIKHWVALREFEMDRPQHVLREGLVSAALAARWADAVWREDDDA